VSSSITSSKLLSSTRYTYGWEGTPGSSEAVERVNGVISRRNLAVRRATPVLFSGAETPTSVVWVDGSWRRFTGSAVASGAAVPTLRFLLNDGQTGISEGVYVGVSCVVGNQTSEPQTVSLDLSDNVPTQVTLAPGEIQRVSVGAFATADPYQFVDLALTPKYPRYRWTGTPNASSSESITASGVRTNLVPNPAVATDSATWSYIGNPSPNRIVSAPGFNRPAIRMVRQSSSVSIALAQVPIVPGRRYVLSASINNPTSGQQTTIDGQFLDANQQVVLNVDRFVGSATGMSRIATNSFVAPANAVTLQYRAYRDSGADGDTYVTDYQVEEGMTATAPFSGDTASATPAAILFRELQIQTGSVGTYFDPNTPARTDTVYASSQPVLVTGYQSRRQTAHVFHDVLGGGQDVTLRPASPRSGTLSCLFTSEAEALNCENIHTGTDILTFADSDLPTTGMTYVADGAITRALDSQSRALWTVDIDYREVTP
jgi:hypothetical protein